MIGDATADPGKLLDESCRWGVADAVFGCRVRARERGDERRTPEDDGDRVG